MAIIDIYSRYEMNAVVAAETQKEELAILDQWINNIGCPSQIRTDASGAHMSNQFLQYTDDGSPSPNGDGGAVTCSPTSSTTQDEARTNIVFGKTALDKGLMDEPILR